MASSNLVSLPPSPAPQARDNNMDSPLAALPPSRAASAQASASISFDEGARIDQPENANSPPDMRWTGQRMAQAQAQHNLRMAQHSQCMAQQKAIGHFDSWLTAELQKDREMLLSSLRIHVSSRLQEHRNVLTAQLCDDTTLQFEGLAAEYRPQAVESKDIGASTAELDAIFMEPLQPCTAAETKNENGAVPAAQPGVVDVVDKLQSGKQQKVDGAAPAEGDVVDILGGLHKKKEAIAEEKGTSLAQLEAHGRHLPEFFSQALLNSYGMFVDERNGVTAEFGPRFKCVQNIVAHRYFEVFSTLFIFLSTVLVAAEVQVTGSQIGYELFHKEFPDPADPEWENFFTVLSCITNGIFLTELLLRLITAQAGAFCAPWLWLDFSLVALGLVDLLSTLGVPMFFSGGSTFRVAAIRMLRLLRIVRLIRVLRKRSALHSLFLLLKSIHAAVGASIWSFVLLLLIMMVAGLMVSQLIIPSMRDTTLDIAVRLELFDHFGTFTKTMVTMFEITSANWVPTTRMVMTHIGEGTAYMIVFYRCVFCFAVVNVIRAVFMAETARVAAADDEVAMLKRDRAAAFMRSKMISVFAELDRTGDGLVTWEEFSSCLQDDEVMNFMHILDLDVHDCCNVFRILDTDGSGGITCEEFMDGIKAIRGQAKRIDVATLMSVTRKIELKIDAVLQDIEYRSSSR